MIDEIKSQRTDTASALPVLCIYHRNCADGLGAAWAVHRALGAGVDYHAAAYSDEGWPDVTGRDVLIVDFSYKRPVLEEMARRARSVLVLDHHKTAAEELARVHPPAHGSFSLWKQNLLVEDLSTRIPEDKEAGDWLRSNLAAIFDMERSGAGITWDYLHRAAWLHGDQPPPRPRIIDLIEDRDLWWFNYGEETRAFHATLTSYDIADLSGMLARLDEWYLYTSGMVDPSAHSARWRAVLDEGRSILRYERALVAGMVAGTRRAMRIAGHVVPVANVPGQLASETGNLMCSQSWDTNIPNTPPPPFTATYYDSADDRRHFSLRSPPGGADVGAIAKQFGGGGHKHAAGFDAPIGWEGDGS